MELPDSLYRAFFASAPVGCGISDQRGQLIDFNEAMRSFSGWSRDEVLALGSVTALYYDGPAERDRLLALTRAQGMLAREEVRFKKKDGGFFWAAMSLTPAELDGTRYWLAVVEDISKTKEALAEGERQLRELQQQAKFMVDRELKMAELKKENQHLRDRLKKANP